MVTPQPSPTPTRTPSPTPASILAKIEILWPHGNRPVSSADLANLTAYLFLDDALNPVDCAYQPVVRLWRSRNAEPARFVKLGAKRLVERNGLTFPVWDFNDVDVSDARDPANKLFFFVTVDGVTTRRNVWAHAADARTYFPQQDTPTSVVPFRIEPVDAKIQIVWPHGLPVDQATQANITGLLFVPGTTVAAGPSNTWNPQVWLHASLNNGVDSGRLALGSLRTVGSPTYRAWDFNDIDVSAARAPENKLFFWLEVEGSSTQPNIWSHGADARTIFPSMDTPVRSCR